MQRDDKTTDRDWFYLAMIMLCGALLIMTPIALFSLRNLFFAFAAGLCVGMSAMIAGVEAIRTGVWTP